MKRALLAYAVSLLLFLPGISAAAASPPISISYEGTIGAPFGAVGGTVGGTDYVNKIASGTDFWDFSGTAGDVVDIFGMRLEGGLDLAFTLYQGTTTALESGFEPWGNFGGMTLLTWRDDEWGPIQPGPFADPALYSFTLPSTGDYTIAIGGIASDDVGPYTYELFVGPEGSAPSPVPLPGAVWLLGSALLALVGFNKGVA